MVLTNTQIVVFFKDADNMGLPHDTVIQLQNEGIDNPMEPLDFDKDSLNQVAENLQSPGGWIPIPDPNAVAELTILRPPFVFSAKSQKHLLEACNLMRFYEKIVRPLTVGNI